MKIALKVIVSLFLILVLALGLAVMTPNLWVGPVVAAVIHNATGFPVTIKKVDINLGDTSFGVYGIKIMNPKTFDGALASIPEIFVDFDVAPFFKERKLRFETIRLNIEEFSIIRNKQGVTNLDQLKTLKKDKTKALPSPPTTESRAKSKFVIDQLVLTIRNVNYQDKSLPIPINRTVDINMKQEVFLGLTSVSDVVRLILMKIFYSASLGNLGVSVDLLKEQFEPSLMRGQEVLTQSTEIAQQLGTQVLGEGMKFVEGATSKISTDLPVPAEVNKITEDVKGKASGLFKGAERFLKTTTDTLAEKVESKSDSSKSQP